MKVRVARENAHKFYVIRSKYGDLFCSLITELKQKIDKKEIELDALKTFLKFASPDLECGVDAAESVESVMSVVRNNYFFTNTAPLEEIARKFSLSFVQKEIEAFILERKKYYEEIRAEDFITRAMEEYDKDSNVEVRFCDIP